MAETIKLGSLYFNGRPVSTGERYEGEKISFGDTVPGKVISFIKWKGLYVADRCICTIISWEDLNKHGFIFGRPVRIDGVTYLCRSLKVGAEKGAPSEWDAILDDLGDDNNFWHWKNRYFWGQETPSEYPSSRAICGYASARYWYYSAASHRYVFVGFRPVLEPLPPEVLISDAMVGSNLKLYGSNWSITGRLAGFSDYDLELISDSLLPENCLWARKTKSTVFVDREAIMFLCKKE